MWINETRSVVGHDHLKLPVQLLLVDPYFDSCHDVPFSNLARLGIVEPHLIGDLAALETELVTSVGKVIVAVTTGRDHDGDVVNLAKRIVRLNATRYLHVELVVELAARTPALPFVDTLESLGTRVLWQSTLETREAQIRFLAWRFQKAPSTKVPCFYLHYPDCNTLEVFLLGRRQRTPLIYGEQLGVLFEMMALGRRWVTSREIAEELGISRSSTKVYLDRLRGEYDSKRDQAGVNIPGECVFCSERRNGVWMHRLRGQIIILD